MTILNFVSDVLVAHQLSPPAAAYLATSTTSLLIGTGSKTFATQSGLAYRAGQRARLMSAAVPANYMEGEITAYSGTSMTVQVDFIGPTASGTHADWSIGVAGEKGAGDLLSTLNLADIANPATARNNLGLDDASIVTKAGQVIPVFGGRLTSQSGASVPNADVIGSQQFWYAPHNGGSHVSTYTAAAGWALTPFTANSNDQVGQVFNMAGHANFPADSTHDVFEVFDPGSSSYKLGTRLWDAGMFPTEAAITSASIAASGGAAGYITTGTTPHAWTNPGNAFNGTTSQLASACAITSLPNIGNSALGEPFANFLGQDWGSGVTKTISKVVIYAPSDAWFCGQTLVALSITIEGSNDGTNWHFMNITRCNDTGAAGQVVTIPISKSERNAYRYHRVGFDSNDSSNNRCAQIVFYNEVAPAAGRRITFKDGIPVNDAVIATMRTGATTTITNVPQYEAKHLGTIHIDSATAGQLTTHVKGGPSRVYGIWNAHNQVPLKLSAFSLPTVKFYTPVTSQLWNKIESGQTGNGGGGIEIQIAVGSDKTSIKADLRRNVYLNTATLGAPASYECGIGIDTALSFSGMEGSCNIDGSGIGSTGQGGSAIGFMPLAIVVVPPGAGVRNLIGIERQGNNGTGGQSASTGPRNSHFVAEWMG